MWILAPWVIGMWLSPSHDDYLLPKAKALGTIGLSAGFRLEVARQATADDPLIAVGAWESQQPGYPSQWPDFPIVTLELENALAKFDPRPVVFLCLWNGSRSEMFAVSWNVFGDCGYRCGSSLW